MNDLLITLIRQGYEVHLVPIKTPTGLHHPKSETHMGITMLRRIPGLKRKGGSCYANGDIPWSQLNDPKAMAYILTDLQKRVDRVYRVETKKHPMP